MKLLLIEDERRMAEALAQVLGKNNYAVDTAHDGEDGLNQALTGLYDIIVLDIRLPKLSGLELLKRLRAEHVDTPVILLTARTATDDRIKGLDCGADDYLCKPFETGELLARLRALGRRKSELLNDGLLTYGDLTLDPVALTLSSAGGQIKLTLKESLLLELLLTRKALVTTKEMIIEKLWGLESDAEDNHAEVYISFLRKKLSHIHADTVIETIRGSGYRLKGGQAHV